MKRWVDRLEQLESTLKEFLKVEWKGINSTVVSKFSGGKPVEKWRLYEYFLSVWLEHICAGANALCKQRGSSSTAK